MQAADTAAAERQLWLSARKAERRREDFCSALNELGEQLDDILAYAENYPRTTLLSMSQQSRGVIVSSR